MQTTNEQNPFYLKLETGTHFGGSRILAMTHLPRVFSLNQAMLLAAHLIKLAGGLDSFEESAREVGLIPPAPTPKELPAADQVEPNVAMLQAAGSSTAEAQLEPIGSGNDQANTQEPDQAPDVAADSPAAPTSGSSPAPPTPAAS